MRGLSALPPAGWATEALQTCASPATRTQNLPGFNRTLNHLSLEGVSPGPENRTRCVLLPKQAGQPSPSSRKSQAPPGFYLLSTVEFSMFDTAGAPGWGHGGQESNLRHPVLETGALTELSYTHREM